jgi:copper resistance protein C
MCAFLCSRRALTLGCFFIIALAFGATRLAAHAILESSTPAIDSTVKCSSLPITLTFNVRIDAARSQLRLLYPNASLIDLPAQQTSPDTLATKITGLKPGSYTILWQVLAPDGHITRGEIPFKVAKP